LAIITDTVPPARRGKALGSVMAAFSLASILGVPAGLELAGRFGFRAPFFTLAAVGLVITLLSTRLLPSLKAHLDLPQRKGLLPTFDRLTLLSLANTTLVMMGVFAIVPNLSAFVQHNLGYPREMLGMLYLVGGVASFLAMQVAGFLVDRFGALPLVVAGTVFHLLALDFLFLDPWDTVPIFLIFTLYMLSGSVRMVPMQTLATQVPEADQRARFMSAQSAVQHLSSAIGAFVGSALLIALPDGTLVGIERIAWAAAGAAALVPFLIFFLERGLRERSRSEALISQLDGG
jgi:predicted MFS family arabinose efflux permease